LYYIINQTKNIMKLETTEKLVNKLLSKNWKIKTVYGLKTINLKGKGWSFKGFDNAKKRLGICYGGSKKQIGLSTLITLKSYIIIYFFVM